MRILFLLLFSIVAQALWSQDNARPINGHITDGISPLHNVHVKIINSNIATSTNTSGYYSLSASVGDVIEYTHMGYTPIRVVVEDVTHVLNLEMPKIPEELKEVTVNGNRSKSQREMLLEYEANTDLIRTAYGFLNKRKSATALNIIDESEFLPGALTFLDAIQGQFNGRATFPDGIPVVYLRERPNLMSGSQAAIYDVDGAIVEEAPISIPVTEIKRIAILRGLNATSRYGTRANGGVIIINTKTGSVKPKTDAIEVLDLQEAHAAFIEQNFCKPSAALTDSNGLHELLASKSETTAIATFRDNISKMQNAPYLLIDAANHFHSKWGNQRLAKEIWDKVKIEFSDNSNVLKAIAYYYEQNGYLKEALNIYQKVSALRPNYAQTYRDLAYMHHKLDNPEQALNIYSKFLNKNKKAGYKETLNGIDFIISIEAIDILTRNKMEVSKTLKKIEVPFKDAPTRILLEWNNGETEFDVEMIKKDKSYLVWKHNYVDKPKQITAEKKLGYSMQQFFVDKNDVGKWVFNMNYFGNKSSDPSYLKATIQYNYGSTLQKDKVKVIRLPEQRRCLNLFSI